MNHQREIFSSSQPLILESGTALESFDLIYDTYGCLNEAQDNVILIFHAFSGSHHAAGKLESDQDRGWWDGFIGPNKVFDTNKNYIICINNIGSCFGSTGPSSLNKLTNTPYGENFPEISVKDWNQAIFYLLCSLKINNISVAVGSSLGGMQVMDLISKKDVDVKKGIIIGATHKPRQLNILLNHVQRSILKLDDSSDALKVARMLSHVSYISNDFLQDRFQYNTQDLETKISDDIVYESENYLSYHGEKFVKRFNKDSFILMTKAMDSFYFDESKIDNISSKVLLISFDDDLLFPAKDMVEFHKLLKLKGVNSKHKNLKGTRGHDSFLYLTKEYKDELEKFINS